MDPDAAMTAVMSAIVLGPALVFPRPSVMAFLEAKTVVSTSVCLLVPAPGITPPWIPRPVVFPPASPVYTRLDQLKCESGRKHTMTAILPWAATRGDAARATRKTLANIFTVMGW